MTLTEVDKTTGEVTTRRSSRWHGPFVRRGSGFVSVNDGVQFAEQLLAALEDRPYRPGGSPAAVAAAVDDELAARRAAVEAYQAAIRDLAA